jgi:hydrogenase expression/formation protein HypC
MCVAVPGRITWIGESTAASIPAQIETGGATHDVDLVMVPEAVVGDYVVVHAGYVINVIPQDRARDTLELFGVEP